MKSIQAKTIYLILVGLTTLSANADPYRDWSDEVMKATKGLKICSTAYWDAIGGKHEDEWKKYLPDATRTCGVMKMGFNTTMLVVRKNVNGMDDILKTYHSMVLAAFDRIVPKTGQNPLEYYVLSLETVKVVYEQHLKISALDGGW